MLRWRLVAQSGLAGTLELPPDRPVVLGRASDTSWPLPETDAGVSRYHVSIEIVVDGRDERPLLRDMKSRAGTYVNDRKVDVAVLSSGDLIRVGGTLLRVESFAHVFVESRAMSALAFTVPLARKESAERRWGEATTLASPQTCVYCGAQGPQLSTALASRAPLPWACSGCAVAQRWSDAQWAAERVDVPRLLGDYDLLAPLGEGGMARVFRARHRSEGLLAALKVPRIESISGEDGLKRFITEQQLVSQLEHPCLLTCYDVGIDSASGLLYIASELALGGDTERLAGPTSPLPLVCAIGADLFAGLAHAHAQHVVHRDVKPANVLLASPAPTASGRLRAKLSDFGLAKRLRSLGASARTKAGQILGSPWFMAPEQMLAHDTRSPAIDVYGGAITLYYLLTGTVPLRIDRPVYELSPAAACLAALDSARVPLRDRRPEVPVAVGQWIDLLVSRDAAQRAHIGAGQVAEMCAAHAR